MSKLTEQIETSLSTETPKKKSGYIIVRDSEGLWERLGNAVQKSKSKTNRSELARRGIRAVCDAMGV